MPTGYSILEYTGDGSTDTFSINFTLGYLSMEHIQCRVADEVDGSGNPEYRTLYPVAGNPGVLRVGGTVPAVGEKVVFTRTVPKDTLTNDYADGAILTGDNLDNSMKQAMMAVHEALDGRNMDTVYTDMDMTGHKLLNVFTDPADPDSLATVGYIGDAPVQAAAAAVSAAAALASQTAAAASEAAAEAAQVVCEAKATEAAASADRAEGALDGNTNVMLGLAMRLAVLTDTNARDFLLNSWTDPIVSADFVTATGAEFVDADGGYMTNAGADNVVTAIDLTAAQFLDEKGGITTFTVDTANTSGHFDAAVSARVKAGCRMVINGVSYPITGISGDGTASNSVVFSGTMTTGDKTVSGIYGCELDAGSVRLSMTEAVPSYSHALSSGDRTAHITVTASAGLVDLGVPSNLVDGATGVDSTDAIDFTAGLAVAGHTITFVFDEAICIKEATYTNYNGAAQGVWKWQVLVNGSWVTVSSDQNIQAVTVVCSLAGNTAFSTTYRMLGVSGVVASTGRDWMKELTFKIAPRAFPTGVVYPLSLAVDCTDWSALTALSATETLNSQNLWYALSFDGGTTYSAFVSGAWLPIVRNNSGTWEYWTGSAWAASGINSALGAMAQAAGVAGNRMDGATMVALSQAQIEGSGGFVPGQTSLPLMAALYSGSSTATPVLSGLSLTSDIQPHDCTITFDEFPVTDPDFVKAVLVVHAVDTITVNTDLKAWALRGTGEYVQVTLAPDSYIDGSTPLLVGNADLSAGAGDACTFKITSHNHKELRIKSAANYVRSV